jgi:uncharacterized membrane-anchored protein
VIAQVSAKRFHPYLYWFTIIATTTVGTTMADLADRSLGLGYAGGSSLLLALLLASLGVWYWSTGSISVATVDSPKTEIFYWVTIMFSQTLGTALGDWAADDAGLGYLGGVAVFRGTADCCGSVPLYEDLEDSPLLECIHPDAPARRSFGRSV